MQSCMFLLMYWSLLNCVCVCVFVCVFQIREGSVIVVVVLEDTEDDTGANITVLVFQMEEDVCTHSEKEKICHATTHKAKKITVFTHHVCVIILCEEVRCYAEYCVILCTVYFMQYNEGLLVIRSDAGEDALVPTEDFKAETVTQEEEEDDDDDFVWWHGLLIGIAVAAVILSVVFTVIVSSLVIELPLCYTPVVCLSMCMLFWCIIHRCSLPASGSVITE